jgi:hypothetical protein
MVLEEAHNFAPEKGFGKTLSNEILRKIASEGRKFGLGMGVISQRPARIDKNVLSQCNTQFILRVTNPNDLKAISKSFEGITSEVESMITSLPPGVSFVLGNEYPVMTSVRTRKSKHGGTTQTAEDYEEKKTVEYYEPKEDKKEVESRENEKYDIAYYPLYLLENDEKKMLVDGVEGDVKAERRKPTGIQKKVYCKLESSLERGQILDELEIGLAKFSNIKESLREQGLIKEDSLEITESVTQLDTYEDNVEASAVIEYEVEPSQIEDMLENSELKEIYYPYYSRDNTVYDPILKQEVG